MAKKCNTKTSIGGQAVLEGVMMKSPTSIATAVRDADGVIRLETKRTKHVSSKSVFFRLPIIRGVVAFLTSLIEGSAILMRSAEVYGEGDPSRFEKWLSEKLKINLVTIVTVLGLVLGLGLAVFLFMWLPQFLRATLENLIHVEFGVWAKNFIEGGLKLLVFICYILLCSLLKDIRRTFMYHGAEHKVIETNYAGKEINLDNCKQASRVSDNCGTMLASIMIFIYLIIFVFELVSGINIWSSIELTLGITISYELFRVKRSNILLKPVFKLGYFLQEKCFTKEPNEHQLAQAMLTFSILEGLETKELTLEDVNEVLSEANMLP